MKRVWRRFLVPLRNPRWGALSWTLLSLLVLLLGWVWLGNWFQQDLIQQSRAKVSAQINAGANALTSAINQRIALLQGLYAFTRTEWPDAQFDQSFEIYSAGLYFNSTGMRTLMIAPEGIARYIFPIYDTSTLSGYDILHDPDPATRADVQRAIHTREITLSQPGELRQGGFGLTAWRAVYRGKDLWGLVSVAVDLKTVLADSGLAEPAGGLDLALQDSLGVTFFGPADLWQRDPVVQTITMPEGTWELGGAPQGGWAASVRFQANLFRLSTLIAVGLLACVVYLVVNHQGQLEQAVALRTRQIAAAQQVLEQRVQERTQELSTLLVENARLYEQNSQLAVLEERQRLARELHDSVSQVLYSIGLGAKAARAALTHNPSQIGETVDYVSRLAEAGQVEMRALIFELRPESLRTDGLVSALEKQAAVLQTRHQLTVQRVFCAEPLVPLTVKEAIYRVSQEATHNIIKHARATHVTITLACSENEICLEVTDDGIGFDPLDEYPGHLGLQSMRERANQSKGQIQLDSHPGLGTRIMFTIPFEEK